MKAILFVALAGLALAAALPALKHEEYEFIFGKWATQHGKSYATKAERALRLSIFKSNLDYIRKHQAKPNRDWELSMNMFGDLSNEEFKAQRNGYKPQQRPHYRKLNTKILPVTDVSSIDWVAKGAVAPIKDQGQCGSCWAFSAISSLESANWQRTGTMTTLSEQQLVDCSGSFGNEGCEGGLMDSAFQYMEQTGEDTEAQYPYTAQDGTCNVKTKGKIEVSTFTDVQTNNTAQLLAAIAIQPVSVAVDAGGSDWQFYSGGVLTDSGCGTQLDHGVVAVGFDSTASTKYIKVRNSWGTSWGEAGYIRLGQASGAGICGINMDPSYPESQAAKSHTSIRKH